MTKQILLVVTALVASSAFPVAAAPDKLVITNVNASAAPESATVTWTTNLPATSQLDWGTSASNLSLQKADASFVTAHSVTITGLQPGTTYFIQITSVSEQGERVVQIVGEPARAPGAEAHPAACAPSRAHRAPPFGCAALHRLCRRRFYHAGRDLGYQQDPGQARQWLELHGRCRTSLRHLQPAGGFRL